MSCTYDFCLPVCHSSTAPDTSQAAVARQPGQ